MTPQSSEVTAGTNATADQYNQLRDDVLLGLKVLTTVADSGTVSFDLSLGNVFKTTLAGNRTLAVSNPTNGQIFTLIITQDATGSRVPTWFAGISWVGGVIPTLTTTANKRDIFTFIVEDTGVYLGFVSGQNI